MKKVKRSPSISMKKGRRALKIEIMDNGCVEISQAGGLTNWEVLGMVEAARVQLQSNYLEYRTKTQRREELKERMAKRCTST